MAKIRRAEPADIDALVAMGRALRAESPRFQERNFDEAKVRALTVRVLAEPEVQRAAAWVAETGGQVVGMFVGMLVGNWFGGDVFATDLTVYVKPDHRGGFAFDRLLRAYETWAREQGCVEVSIGISTEINVDSTVYAYKRRGYSLTGYTMSKVL